MGAVLFGDGAGALAERGRPVGDGGARRPRHPEPRSRRRARGRGEPDGGRVYELLNAALDRLAEAKGVPFPAALTRSLHVLPHFHGNRSPRADPTLLGAISGLRLSDGVDDLAVLYLATIQAIAQGTRHILEAMNARKYQIDTILMCGGGTKNPVFLREHADVTGCRVVLGREPEAVLLGAAMLGAVASGDFRLAPGRDGGDERRRSHDPTLRRRGVAVPPAQARGFSEDARGPARLPGRDGRVRPGPIEPAAAFCESRCSAVEREGAREQKRRFAGCAKPRPGRVAERPSPSRRSAESPARIEGRN